MQDSLKEALQLARKMELDGIAFYTEGAIKAANPQGRRLFESLASDEERHLEVVESIAKGAGVDVSEMPRPNEGIRTAFTNAWEEIGEEGAASADEKRAIEIGLGMEEKSYKLYHESAGTATDKELAAIFTRLAEEEDQHYVILKNTLEYLEQNSKWMLWEEWGLLTGDMSSLGEG